MVPVRRRAVAAVAAAVLLPAGVAFAACPSRERAKSICDAQLREFDGTDVFALSPNQVLKLARVLDTTEVRLRTRLPGSTLETTRPVRLGLRHAGRLGRIYARAYRADPSDKSLPQEAAFENGLRDLQRTARRARLRACSVRLATP
jgi:hypothetical protein